MPRANRKSPEELMKEAIWTRMDVCRVLRIAPKTLDKYLYHPDPKKRLPSLKIGSTIMVDRQKVLKYFEYKPFEQIIREMG
jgi:hypothetical protein